MCLDAVGDIGGALIQGQAEQSAENQAGNTQAALQGQSIQTQLDYENTMQNALRQAIGGVTSGGNPFMEAASGRTPSPIAGGSFGPGTGTPGAAAPTPAPAGPQVTTGPSAPVRPGGASGGFGSPPPVSGTPMQGGMRRLGATPGGGSPLVQGLTGAAA